ncbi:MAG: Slx4p interacting protein [Phylliscum demangeonii]|nr:MAG: Slx4p interacting protein [Phylliscum demangeonii]
MELRPIPAFYCCYLLRSTVRHTTLYVGSTPNPVRRLAQHNGQSPGGAVRTSRESLRPWEMACLVAGFPSSIAALQFEWAWQNTSITRHIPAGERITRPCSVSRRSAKTGRRRRRPVRPRMSLTDTLANLHLLLRVDSFRRWPLRVVFFCEDVFGVWQACVERAPTAISDDIAVVVDPDGRAEAHAEPSDGRRRAAGGIQGIDLGYTALRPQLQKSTTLLKTASKHACAVCRQSVAPDAGRLANCVSSECEAVAHLKCLGEHFLAMDSDAGPETLLPTKGKCPACAIPTQWVEVVRELTLRTRGGKEAERLLRPPKAPRAKKEPKATKKLRATSVVRETPADDDADDDASETDDSLPSMATLGRENTKRDAGGDFASTECGWRYIDEDEDEDDRFSDTSTASRLSLPSHLARGYGPSDVMSSHKMAVVIEDSDDGAEMLD